MLSKTATNLLDQLTDFVKRHQRLFVLTGAGCSTDSGIPDYRDANGDWKRPQPVRYQEFIRRERTRQRYWARSLLGWPVFAQAQPNPAHFALAHLEAAGFIHQLVTQNVDGLHQRAGSRQIIDLHGRLDTIVCLHCQYQESRETFQHILLENNPCFALLTATYAPDGDADLEGVDFSRFNVPGCPRCGGLLKPDVVFFGESVPTQRVETTFQRLAEAEALLVVGSSLAVLSGYRYCKLAISQRQPIAAINLGYTRADSELTLKCNLSCGPALVSLLERLGVTANVAALTPTASLP